MLRFSVALVAVAALIGATTVTVSPASAYSGAAYDKCMVKCQKSGLTNSCPRWCERRN
jgi:hypothetical protein